MSKTSNTDDFNSLSRADKKRFRELEILVNAARGIVTPRADTSDKDAGATTRNSFGFPICNR